MKLYKEKRIIYRYSGQKYMIRWYIIKNKYFNIMLHKILLSDHNCCHDHPWDFISLILKGGYVETVEHNPCEMSESYRTKKIIHPGQIIFRKAEHRHKLDIYQTCWSLVLRFKVKRRWGFWIKDKWVHWKLFNETSDCG